MSNNGPPKDADPVDLWTQITAMPRPHRLVPFPRLNAAGERMGEIAMVPLTQGESQAATLGAEKWVRGFMKDTLPSKSDPSIGYETLYETRATLEVLFRSCKKADDLTRPFFPGCDAISSVLTVDEIGVLFRAYTLVRAEIGPVVASMSQDEFDAWVEVLGRGGSLHPLALLSVGAQSALLLRMAAELLSLRTANTSPGTPPDDIT